MFIASARDVVATTPGVALAFLFGSAARDELEGCSTYNRWESA
jgi:predicted nucleotidyltransferase